MTQAEKLRALIAYHAAGARLGREGDFAVLVQLCDARLRAHARRLCDDAETARDIAQDAWIAIARSLPTLRDETAFLAFALRIVTRAAARDLGRKRRRRVADAGFGEAQPDHVAAPDDGAAAPDLQAAIAALPLPQRVALALFYLDGLSVAEVAHALDVPPGTVKTRLMHARARLRARLEGDDNGQP
ncbi:MAG: sigma-70 family RNA polymerase sigma factor [Rhodobacteraceae bacterium]|nr:sigma-70 family RNA polymerase sigma factor [Paracoccaceae bacterium]